MAAPSVSVVKIPLRSVFFQLMALSAFGLAQPLLQLMGKNPDFLVVHHSGLPDLILMLMALFLALPLVLSGVVWLVGLAGAQWHLRALGLSLGFLVALILLPVIDGKAFFSGWISLLGAAALALLFAHRYGRSAFLQKNLSALALAVPVFVGLFLASGQVRALLTAPTTANITYGQGAEPPVIFIVLDEFPITSLMTPDQELDCDLFPNFCRLAEKSTWFRRATSVSGATLRAVPAIMTGQIPDWKQAPTVADHPQNIFTLLGGSHQIVALESQTDLCPDDLKSEPAAGLTERLALLLDDTWVLYQHVVVPEKWEHRLIPVSEKWSRFRQQGHNSNGRRLRTKVSVFGDFVQSIEKGPRPTLAAAHVLLPHSPYCFLPGGQIYTWRKKAPSQSNGTWGPDKLVMTHSFRRHLVQAMAVDELLGDLLDRLEQEGLFDEAIIMVTADHGMCFRTGVSLRRYDERSIGEIMSVPLFIKEPHQQEGRMDDRWVQTLDIMPTLAGLLGLQAAEGFEGMDVFSTEYVEREELDFFDQDARVHRKISLEARAGLAQPLAFKAESFKAEGGLARLIGLGDQYSLIGQRIPAKGIPEDDKLIFQLSEGERYQKINLDADFLPAEILGTVSGKEGDGRLQLALALNGVIAGVTETYLDADDQGHWPWQVLVAPSSLQKGKNEIEIFRIQGPDVQKDLIRISSVRPSFLGKNLGGKSVAGVQEEGLYGTHNWDGQPSRWTNGTGVWKIPLTEGDQPKFLELATVSCGAKGNRVQVLVNGKSVLTEDLKKGAWSTEIPLKGMGSGSSLRIELKSETFIPAEQDANSGDTRPLGLAVTKLIVR